MRDYHCCATCIHFGSEKTKNGMLYMCKRLGFQTDPRYKFECWNPKEQVRRLMERDQSQDSE